MSIRTRSSRPLLACAIAAAPLGAHAITVSNASFECASDGSNRMIGLKWDNEHVDGTTQGIIAVLAPPPGAGGGTPVPFKCDGSMGDGSAVTAPSVAVDFGVLIGLLLPAVQLKIDTFDTVNYKEQTGDLVTDFNLYIGAYDATGKEDHKDYLGLKITSNSFGSYKDFTATIDANMDFKIQGDIPGGMGKISLLAQPEAVPLPPSLPLLGVGLAGVAALSRRKRDAG